MAIGSIDSRSLPKGIAMNQSELDREVAKATGETVLLIRQLGFTELVVPQWVAVPALNETPVATEPGLAPSSAETG